jgi:hypothetical protein
MGRSAGVGRADYASKFGQLFAANFVLFSMFRLVKMVKF